jgi:hypothetical protein
MVKTNSNKNLMIRYQKYTEKKDIKPNSPKKNLMLQYKEYVSKSLDPEAEARKNKEYAETKRFQQQKAEEARKKRNERNKRIMAHMASTRYRH